MNKTKVELSIKKLQELIDNEQIYVTNPRTLSGDKKELLMKELLPIARDCFRSDMSYEEIYEHAFDVDRLTLVTDLQKNIIGMKAVSYFEDESMRVLYFAGSFISKEYQGRSLLTGLNLLQFALDPHFDYFSARTQNPAIYRSLQTVGDIAPSFHKKPYLRYSNVAQLCGMENVDEGNLLKGFYGQTLYDKIPQHTDLTPFFEVLGLNYLRGDAVFIVGKNEVNVTLEQLLRGKALPDF